ncbi:hypothetical protein M885DRAFT_573945 [Pelagophyceae sp. CCMP2097]|nr:hypothetical protein M885DRAFT_573945 [Pelagophyceae sp. CCMP2097]
MRALGAWAAAVVAVSCAASPGVLLEIQDAAGELSIVVAGEPWLVFGDVLVRHRGRAFSSADGSLRPVGEWTAVQGGGALGAFIQRRRAYDAGAARRGAAVVVSYRVYDDGETCILEHAFPDGLNDTAVPGAAAGDAVATEWPALRLADAAPALGALSFGGRFMESSKARAPAGTRAGACAFSRPESLSLGAYGGPFALFGAGDDNVLVWAGVVSSASNFATTSVAESGAGGAVAVGVMGSVTSIPPGHVVATLVRASRFGLTAGVKAYGAALLRLFGTVRRRELDYTLKYLGYSTDNGAYYYYHPNGAYERTLLGVADYARAAGVPYRYTLLDSWWYAKGSGGGIKDWNCTKEALPSGCATLSARTGWKFQLHSKTWAADTKYAKQNGGGYDFLVEGALAIPISQRFWDDLMANASAWGMAVYEQDWICAHPYDEFQGLNTTLQSATLARDWLLQMAAGAEKAGAAVQYCMELPRFVLQAAEAAAVTQFRGGDDIGAANDAGCAFPFCVYYVGTASLLSYALDLAPSKDSFWSTADQPGNAFGDGTVEKYSAMQAATAVLSHGPVQVSDGVGFSDAALIARACDVSHTLHGGRRWAHVLVINLAEDYVLEPRDLAPVDLDASAAHLIYTGYGAAANVTVADFTSSFVLPACGMADFRLCHTAPVMPNGWAYLGEPAKWVPVSTARTVAAAQPGRAAATAAGVLCLL